MTPDPLTTNVQPAGDPISVEEATRRLATRLAEDAAAAAISTPAYGLQLVGRVRVWTVLLEVAVHFRTAAAIREHATRLATADSTDSRQIGATILAWRITERTGTPPAEAGSASTACGRLNGTLHAVDYPGGRAV